MSSPFGSGQARVLKTHYNRVGDGPVAYLDETYHLEFDGRHRFYVMAAVVVLEPDRDPMRTELDTLVPDGWWHTTDVLRSGDGRERARELLQTFQVQEQICVIVEQVEVDPDDKDGFIARTEVFGRLLTAVHSAEHGTHPSVHLAVVEQQRVARKNNLDRATRKHLIQTGALTAPMELVVVSPGSEHLLWLPDLVCSAYRQKIVFRNDDLFAEIEHLTHVVQLPRKSANPRLP
jgi:hypothetical protein